jgi:hypothetical protein
MKQTISDHELAILEPTYAALKLAVGVQQEMLAAMDRLLLVEDATAFAESVLAHADGDQRLRDLLSNLEIQVRDPLTDEG